MRIAVVEDDPVTALIAMTVLGQAGHQVSLFSEGTVAVIALCGGGTYDALFLDLQLPDMNGDQVLQAVLTAGRTVPPLVLFTAHTGANVPRLARKFGAVTCIIKPFQNQALLEALEMIKKKGNGEC